MCIIRLTPRIWTRRKFIEFRRSPQRRHIRKQERVPRGQINNRYETPAILFERDPVGLMSRLTSSLFDYNLPDEAIAQTPARKRDRSRLLLVNRETKAIGHHSFHELPELLTAGASIFRNTARVLPARLRACRPSGGAVECLLLRPSKIQRRWWCLLRPGRKAKATRSFGLNGIFTATILEKKSDGTALVGFELKGLDSVTELAEKYGEIPLPHYIKKKESKLDKERYQTVYANREESVAIAAPTAGLHFTPETFERIGKRGCRCYDLQLHIGLGTFKPLTTEELQNHHMHTEIYEIPPTTQWAIRSQEGRPRVAVGTTSLRAMEDFRTKTDSARRPIKVIPSHSWREETDIFIYPPHTFTATDSLLTNFHLPRSTLMCLVAAFLTPGDIEGIEWLKEIYRQAIESNYRFYSYGDAMFII